MLFHLLPFVLAVIILMLFPGPNVALITANAMAHGVRYGLLTVAGTASAMVLQLAFTALGMTALLGAAGHWFGLLRWVGAAYLIYLGVKQWRAPPAALRAQPQSPAKIFSRALLVSLTNPKTLFFYGAFFPQFLHPGNILPQIALLSAIFLVIALLIDSGWALAAHRVRDLLSGHHRLRNRVTGGAFIGAGLGLAALRAK